MQGLLEEAGFRETYDDSATRFDSFLFVYALDLALESVSVQYGHSSSMVRTELEISATGIPVPLDKLDKDPVCSQKVCTHTSVSHIRGCWQTLRVFHSPSHSMLSTFKAKRTACQPLLAGLANQHLPQKKDCASITYGPSQEALDEMESFASPSYSGLLP